MWSRSDVALIATTVLMLLYPPGEPAIDALIRALALAILIFPQRLLHRPEVWLTATTLATLGVVYQWDSADNHKYLLAYWLLAVFCSLHANSSESALSTSARFLVAGTMGWAVYHKFTSPDYLTGEFFSHAILLDERFQDVATALAGVSADTLESNRLSVERLTHWSMSVDEGLLQGGPRLEQVARTVTWIGVGMEAVIALVFLLPDAPLIRMLRDWALLSFIVLVYPIATVLGFAHTLTAMGLAQAQGNRTRLVFLICLPLLQLLGHRWVRAF